MGPWPPRWKKTLKTPCIFKMSGKFVIFDYSNLRRGVGWPPPGEKWHKVTREKNSNDDDFLVVEVRFAPPPPLPVVRSTLHGLRPNLVGKNFHLHPPPLRSRVVTESWIWPPPVEIPGYAPDYSGHQQIWSILVLNNHQGIFYINPKFYLIHA